MFTLYNHFYIVFFQFVIHIHTSYTELSVTAEESKSVDCTESTDNSQTMDCQV